MELLDMKQKGIQYLVHTNEYMRMNYSLDNIHDNIYELLTNNPKLILQSRNKPSRKD